MFDPAKEPRTWDEIQESCGIDSKETIKFLAEESYEFFLEHVVGLNTNSDLIQELIDIAQNPPEQPQNKATKIAIMAPRGHSKTYTATIGRSLWIAYRESGKNIILSSSSRTQSKDILRKIKRIIVRNEALEHLKPSTEMMDELGESMDIEDDEDAWAAKSITTTTDVTMATKTYGPSIRSQHVDYVFLDDVLQDEGEGTRSKEDEKDIFYNVISPIAENHEGTLQIVGTPMAHDDLMMELMTKDDYYTATYKAYYPDRDKVLWPDMWTEDRLMSKKREIGPSRFAREYLCEPLSEDEQFYPPSLVKPNVDKDREHWKPSGETYEDWDFFVAVDVAMADGSGNDYTVYQVLGKSPEGDVFHVDQRRFKGLSPNQIVSKLDTLNDRYGFTQGRVERNAIGMGVWKTIQNQSSLSRIEGFDTTRKTRPEILSKLQAAFDRRDLTIVDDSVLLEELYAFKNRNGKLQGKSHDDTVLSLAIAWDMIGDGGYTAPSAAVVGDDASLNDLTDDGDGDIDKYDDGTIVGIV